MTKVNKTSRSSQTRDRTAKRQPWRPPSRLDAPAPPDGFQYRWIRAEIMGQEDKKNVSSRIREGYELVRLEELGDFDAPTIEDGKNEGVVAVGGLLLAKIPTEIADERKAYFANQTSDQQKAVDNSLLREQHPSMPIDNPNRQTRVAFGGAKKQD
jgi:hypothetical protein|tara:strand:- start:164 stop:628 length:465 start_codon:yes stop_codon:yes gene_type:complete